MKARQVATGLGWTAAAALLNLLAQLVFIAILARKLEPSAFGMLAMASVATRFASYFAQMGGAQVLIQAREITPALATAGLLTALGVSIALYAVLGMAAPIFSLYFHSPELVSVLWVFGLTLPLTAIGALPMALLRRQARFGTTSAIEVVGYVIGYGFTGVALASLGYGVWSLVFAVLMQQVAVSVLAFGLVRFPLAWPISRSAWNRIIGFGSRYSLIGFLEFLWANVESLVVGRLIGQTGLGLFNRAQLLCYMPVEQTVSASSKVLFPALSAMQHDRARLADGFLVMLLATGTASAALSSGVSASAPDLVMALLGAQWLDAIPLVQLLSASVAALFIYVVCGIALDGMAALKPKMQMQAAVLIVKLLAMISLVSWGLAGIAWAVVISEILRAYLGLRLLTRLLAIDRRCVWSVLGLMAAIGAAVYLSVWGARLGTAAAGLPLVARLACQMVAGALAVAAVLGLALRHWSSFKPLQRFESIRRRLDALYRFTYRGPYP